MSLLPRLRAHCAATSVPAYLLGGYVRDALQGIASRDVDLAVPGDTAAAAAGIAGALGGTPVPLDGDRGIHRVEGIRAGGAAWRVDVSTLHGGGIEADLRRRDFTVDAIAVPLAETEGPAAAWPLIDPTGGAADLAAGIVRCTSPQVFADDPLRLLRAVRIAVQRGFTIDDATRQAIAERAELLAGVSAERVREELLSTLAAPAAMTGLELLDELGLLDSALPELVPSRGVTQPKEHHWDVFQHTLHCVDFAGKLLDAEYRAADPAGRLIPWPDWADAHFSAEYADGHTRGTFLKLACLLHDVAKPETKTVQPNGRVRFLGHPIKGAVTTREALRRLRVSGKAREAVAVMVEQHLRPSQLAQKGETPTARAVFRYYRDLQDVAVDTLYLSLADFLAARGPDLELDAWAQHCARVAHTLREGRVQRTPERRARLLTGHDLMRLFDLPAGPGLRPLLELVEEAGAAGEVNTREEAVNLVSQALGRAPSAAEAHHG